MHSTVRRVAWTSAAIHGLVHACVLVVPAIFGDIQRAFDVGLLDVLAALNLMYLVFGGVAIPAGLLADRFGSRVMLVIASTGCALGAGSLALAPTFATFTAGLVLLGLGAGLYHPSGLSLLSRGVTSGERGRAIGIHGVGGNLGEVAAPALAALLATTVGWRLGFVVIGGAALAASALALSLPADPVEYARPTRRILPAVRAMWRTPPLRWLLLCGILGGFVYRGVLTFLPLHLGEVAGNARTGAYLTSIVLVAGMVAQRVGGELADRMPRERLFLAEVALFAPVLLLLGLVQGLGLVALALSFGFLWYLAQPLASAMAAAYADAADHGLLYGVQFALSFGLGSFAAGAGGLLTKLGGTHAAFLGFGVAGLGQLAAAAALYRAVRRASPTTAAGAPTVAPPSF